MSRDESFEFACLRKRETDAAVLIVDFATGEEVWIPLSQVHEMHFDKNQEGTIVISAWIARQKGLV
jgi:hypothetical protein